MSREAPTDDGRGHRRPVVVVAVVGVLALVGVAVAWQAGPRLGWREGPVEVDGPAPAVGDAPAVATDVEEHSGTAEDDAATDADGAEPPAFQSDGELTDAGLPGGLPSPQVDAATGLRTDHLVVAVDRGLLLFLAPGGDEGQVKLDQDVEYRDVAVRPGSTAGELTVAVVADRPEGSTVEVVRIAGGSVQGTPAPVAALGGPTTGLVWADDGSALAWTAEGRLAAAAVDRDGTPAAPVDLGAAPGWVADWNQRDEVSGELTLATPRDDGGLGAELREVRRTSDDGFALGPVVGTTDVLVLDADATDVSGAPVRWVIDQGADEVTFALEGDASATPVASVPLTAPPQTYVVGGGVAVVVTDMGSNDGIMRVTADGAVTEIALWRAYDVLA